MAINFIATWDNGPKIDREVIPKWPPNSPDFSAIEIVWSIIKELLNMFPPKNIEELKSAIINIWASIPLSICKRIIEHMCERLELCLNMEADDLIKN